MLSELQEPVAHRLPIVAGGLARLSQEIVRVFEDGLLKGGVGPESAPQARILGRSAVAGVVKHHRQESGEGDAEPQAGGGEPGRAGGLAGCQDPQ